MMHPTSFNTNHKKLYLRTINILLMNGKLSKQFTVNKGLSLTLFNMDDILREWKNRITDKISLNSVNILNILVP